MKTTSQKKSSSKAPDQTAHLLPPPVTEAAATIPQPTTETKPDTRLPIDSEKRQANRFLPTDKVLTMLKATNPELFNLAEVVGRWIWIHFAEAPAAEWRQQLSQLGFHWNRERQAWQHPCGTFRLHGSGDPHEKYEAYFPSDQQAT